MIITVKNFISELAQATKDPSMIVNTATDWLEILNSNGSELSPYIMFEHKTEIDYSTVDTHTNEIDMSSETVYEGLSKIKTIFLKDSAGKTYPYTFWTFNSNSKVLLLSPVMNDNYIDNITYAVRPSNNYPTIIINWLGEIPDTAGDSSLTMDKSRLTLFRKICVREGVRRILMDQMKFDRYRTLVSRANSFELLAIVRDLTAEIELDKGKLANANIVKVF